MSAQRADAAAAGLAATLARMAEVRGGGADGGGDDDGGAKSGSRQISYKLERATHDQASARECHRPTQRRSQECRAARARRARRRGRATATGRHDQKPRGGGWGSRRGSPTTTQASHALMRRPADAARLFPARCYAPLSPRRARRRCDAPAAAAAPARTAIRARASPRLPHATPYYPHDPPVHPASEPPCSIAGIIPHSTPAGREQWDWCCSGAGPREIPREIPTSERRGERPMPPLQRRRVTRQNGEKRAPPAAAAASGSWGAAATLAAPKWYRLATAREWSSALAMGQRPGAISSMGNEFVGVLFGSRMPLSRDAQCPLFEGERGERLTKRRHLA